MVDGRVDDIRRILAGGPPMPLHYRRIYVCPHESYCVVPPCRHMNVAGPGRRLAYLETARLAKARRRREALAALPDVEV